MRMRTKPMLVMAVLTLVGCGGGSEMTVAGPGSVSPLFIGTTGGGASANGLPFADGSQSYADVEGQTLKVKVARYLTDYETGQTSLVISDETVSFAVDDGGRISDFTITIGGETLVYSGKLAKDSNDRDWESFLNTQASVSGTGGIFSYSFDTDIGEPGALDTEGFFAVGFETDPDTIARLATNPSYRGDWYGWGVLVDENGDITASEVDGSGTIDLVANFAAGRVRGSLSGLFDPNLSVIGDEFDISGTITTTSIQGNGFVGDLNLANCHSGFTCTSSSQVAGAFFGADAEEISGIIGFDASSTNDASGASERLISGAGFTASEAAPVE